jgi:glycosyltransferase involved in cell wall biosynthesis
MKKMIFISASARLISYKRTDIIIEAFNWLGLTLLVTGEGPERKAVRSASNEKYSLSWAR